MQRIVGIVIVGVWLILPTSLPAIDQIKREFVDCRPQELKKAEEAFEELVKPHLMGIAERYHTRPERIKEMAAQRQILFRKWLKIRCICQPAGMSRFEQTLCKGLSDAMTAGPGARCLLRE